MKNLEFHKRSKHVKMRYYFVREKYHKDAINVDHADSANQIADIITKPLIKCQHLKLVRMLGLID